MNQNSIQSSDVIVFILAGLVVIGFMVGFIVYFLISYRHKKRDFDLLEKQKLEIEKQKILVETTLEQLASAQHHLIQSEKMASLGVLIAGISHEIQNPLNFVNNFSEINKDIINDIKLSVAKSDLEEISQLLNDLEENENKIHFHGKRADSIVRGMLTHSRNSQGAKTLCDINALAEEYMRLSFHGFRAKHRSFNASMEVDLDPDAPAIKVIPEDISRVFLNIFTNACYAVNEKRKQADPDYKPTISLITKKLDNGIQIIIRDNGNGIPDSIADKIFQPFFTTKPSGEGTGLGLSLSYDIIKTGHGGEISLETKTGLGTSFIINLKK